MTRAAAREPDRPELTARQRGWYLWLENEDQPGAWIASDVSMEVRP